MGLKDDLKKFISYQKIIISLSQVVILIQYSTSSLNVMHLNFTQSLQKYTF